MIKRIAFFLALVCFSAPCFAQTEVLPAPMAVSEGTATIEALPSHAEFLLTWFYTGESLEAGFEATIPTEERLREAVIPWDLQPSGIEVQGPFVVDLALQSVGVSARISFPMAGFRKADSGPKQFGKVCDQVKELAQHFECVLDGPKLVVRDQEAILRAGVKAAAEDAYAAADAIALALNSTVFAVDKVKVLSSAWNLPEVDWRVTPNLFLATCTVRVEVTYFLADRQ